MTTFTSQDISAPGPIGELKGTWTKAHDATAPVVLIIPGSGPTDRNGNNPLGVNAGTYRLLAEGLAKKGISSVRIDKRGMFASADAVPDANAVTISDYVQDTNSWIDAIRQATGTECVWLLGHSEGGLVALAAAQEKADICGLMLVATAGRPLGDVLKEQLRANPANVALLPQAEAAIDTLAAGDHVQSEKLPPPLGQLFAPAVQGFLISVFAIDPRDLAKQVIVPILVLHGERDLQVGMEDAEALKTAVPSAKLVRFPNLNHALKDVSSDDINANLAAYADPDLALGEGVVDTIADFVLSGRTADRR